MIDESLTRTSSSDSPPVFRRSDRIAWRQVGEAILIVPVRTDLRAKHGVYTLNGTAAMLFERLSVPRTVDELAEELSREFDVAIPTARDDVRRFLDDMASFGAVGPVVSRP